MKNNETFKVGDLVRWNRSHVPLGSVYPADHFYIIVVVYHIRGVKNDQKKYKIYGQIDQKFREAFGFRLEKV